MERISYVPFLKAKGGEIDALGALSTETKQSICPFFDYPRKAGKVTSEEFKVSTTRMMKKLARHVEGVHELYFDNFDLDDTQDVDGEDCYKYLLDSLCHHEISVIPVVSIDRSEAHIKAVHELKSASVLLSEVVAVRLTVDDFQSFVVVEYELNEILSSIFELFSYVDLIFDCRVCSSLDATKVANQIEKFSLAFGEKYNIRRRVVCGSSIPASISEICPVGNTIDLGRQELDIFRKLPQNDDQFVFGDYGIVSPNYSDVDLPPEMLGNIMTAKIIYSYGQNHHVMRGRGLMAHGYEQYFHMLSLLCAKEYFRGKEYSFGDKYFSERSEGEGTNCTPSTIVKPSVNAHITFMAQGFTI